MINITTQSNSTQNMSQQTTNLSSTLTAINLSRNQKRLDSLSQQLGALQTAYDLETRVEEKMRLQALIEAKYADIDKYHSILVV